MEPIPTIISLMSELDRDEYSGNEYIEEAKAIEIRRAVRQAIHDVLLHLEEPLFPEEVINTTPRVTLQYDDESRKHLPESLVSFINGLYQGREVEIVEISTIYPYKRNDDWGFDINIRVKPTQLMEGDSDSPGFLKGGIVFPDQDEVRTSAVRLQTSYTPMVYIQGRYELGSWREIQHHGESVSLKEDSDVDLKSARLNPDEYQTFDLGRPVGGEIDPEIIFAIADQYRNLIDARVTTPKPRVDYSTD